MENFILIILCIVLGYAIQKSKVFSDNAAITLNQFVIYISLPAMVLLQVPKLTFSVELVIPVVIAWAVMGTTALLTLYVSRWLAFSKEVTGALMLVTVLTNSSFLGIPLISAYMGQEALPYVMVYDQLGSFIALSVYGTFIASYYSHKSEVSFKIIAAKVFTFPPFLVLIIAFLLMGTKFDANITKVLSSLANTIVPVALVAVGLQLKLRLTRDELIPFSISLMIKLILAPLIAILVAKSFGWDNQASQVAIMEAGMAPMITAGAIASMTGLAPKLSSAIVGYGILFSFVTVHILYGIIG
ncbi:AEC family transporter [Sulfurimonas sp. HSL-1716]|uniref:AEC family transporter n=1 Tax=Hydrocurvibacter sulfurireducens TaxID=3131937 RepID=UPI0031FA1A9C